MNGAVLLHITPVFNDDLSPITPDGGAGPDVTILTNDHVTGNGCIRMNEGGFMNYRNEIVELINHNRDLLPLGLGHQFFISTETGSLEYSYHMIFLIVDGNMVEAGAFSIMYFFCFGG